MQNPADDRLLAVSKRQHRLLVRDLLSIALVAVGLAVSASAVWTGFSEASHPAMARR